MKKITNATELRRIQEDLKKNYDPNKQMITICAGTGCRGYGCIKVKEALETEISKQNLNVEVRATGCFGFCEKGPLVVVHPQKIFYQRVGEKDVADIVAKTVMQGEVIEKLLYRDPATGTTVMQEEEVPFIKNKNALFSALTELSIPRRLNLIWPSAVTARWLKLWP